jgi:hypothetical protein
MSSNGNSVSLDASTLEIVEQLSRAWGVSKEEAVRRAVTQADAAPVAVKNSDRLAAFKQLQSRLQLTPEKAAAWQSAVREGRR